MYCPVLPVLTLTNGALALSTRIKGTKMRIQKAVAAGAEVAMCAVNCNRKGRGAPRSFQALAGDWPGTGANRGTVSHSMLLSGSDVVLVAARRCKNLVMCRGLSCPVKCSAAWW